MDSSCMVATVLSHTLRIIVPKLCNGTKQIPFCWLDKGIRNASTSFAVSFLYTCRWLIEQMESVLPYSTQWTPFLLYVISMLFHVLFVHALHISSPEHFFVHPLHISSPEHSFHCQRQSRMTFQTKNPGPANLFQCYSLHHLPFWIRQQPEILQLTWLYLHKDQLGEVAKHMRKLWSTKLIPTEVCIKGHCVIAEMIENCIQ